MPFPSTWVHPRFFVGFVLFIFLVICVVLLCVFTVFLPCCDGRYDFRIKRFSVRIYLQLFVGGLMSYLRYLCLFAHSGVQHILCCVFVLFFFVLCILCCQFLWIVYFWLPPSVFSNLYLHVCLNHKNSKRITWTYFLLILLLKVKIR